MENQTVPFKTYEEPNFTIKDKLSTILCPASPIVAKLSNKYIAILFSNRKKLDDGVPVNNLTFPPQVEIITEDLSDTEESEASFSDLSENDLTSPFALFSIFSYSNDERLG